MNNKKEIPYGYCHCGCGKKTTLIKANVGTRGLVKGEPNKYLVGHQTKGKKFPDRCGKKNPTWKGGQYIKSDGYVMVYDVNHPYANQNGYIKRSRKVMEKHIGKVLPKNVIIHHINRLRAEDKVKNLLILSSHSEHRTLHHKEDTFSACGNEYWRRCSVCRKYDDVKNMRKFKNHKTYHHIKCYNKNRKKRYVIKQKTTRNI